MRVYDKAIEVNRLIARRVADKIGRQDRELLGQLKQACGSVPLNLAEGLGHRGGNRELSFQRALGSAREVRACLDVADAWSYLEGEDAEVIEAVDHLIRMLFRLVRAKS